jgi:thiol:disulfide interchange protein DsbD
MRRFLFLLSFLFLVPATDWAQNLKVEDVVKWQYAAKNTGENTYEINLSAKIKEGWHIYTSNPGGDGSQIPTNIQFIPNRDIQLNGNMNVSGKVVSEKIEDIGTIHYYKHAVAYKQKIRAKNNTRLKVAITFQTCDDAMCLPPVYDTVQIRIEGVQADDQTSGLAAQDTSATLAAIPTSLNPDSSGTIIAADSGKPAQASKADDAAGAMSLWAIFLSGLAAGFVAFVTPCIYAMLPITVSFFTKRSKNRASGIKNAVIYSLSIIGIFSLIGVLISMFFSETTMYTISTSTAFNLFVFLVFIIFGVSLLGAFEITLPSSWSTKLDTKANSSSFWGIFFMAMVLVIVSFSCTSAFISWLIVQIVQAQNRLGGLVGFLGFGMAIALPFAIFAFFPGLLNNIAKSGGWLNSVKVTMGFVELAMAMKFLSNVDLQYHWHLLDYEVYLAIWIVLFGLLGLYLLGKIRFSHDDELPKNMFGHPYLSVTRLFFAIAALSFTVYMVPGMWGAPLEGISGWLPERKTLSFNLHDDILSIKNGQLTVTSSDKNQDIRPLKYTDNLKSELPGVTAYFDYEEALAASKKLNKPILLDFTGHSCVNCRKMERAVLSKPQVSRELNENFILASLYCDDRTELAEADKYTNKEGKEIRTLGAKNLDLEVNHFGEVGQPIYIFVDSDGNLIKNAGGYVDDVERFVKIMEEVKAAFHKKK